MHMHAHTYADASNTSLNEVNTLAQVNDTMHCKFHTGVSSASLFHSEHILSVTISLTKMQNQKFESLKCIPIYNDENHSLHIIIHIHMYICIYVYTYAYHHMFTYIIYHIFYHYSTNHIYIVIYTFLFAPTHLLYPLCRYDIVSTIYIFIHRQVDA